MLFWAVSLSRDSKEIPHLIKKLTDGNEFYDTIPSSLPGLVHGGWAAPGAAVGGRMPPLDRSAVLVFPCWGRRDTVAWGLLPSCDFQPPASEFRGGEPPWGKTVSRVGGMNSFILIYWRFLPSCTSQFSGNLVSDYCTQQGFRVSCE